jgi:hypothetical protein
MQYTLRNIPPMVDRALRRRAREQGISLNDAALDALARGTGVSDDAGPQRSLRDLAGTWEDDPAFEAAIRDQRAIDERLWG